MIGIHDIAPKTGTIDIIRPGAEGEPDVVTKLQLRGFTLREWATLLVRFPSIDAEIPADGAPADGNNRIANILENLDVARAVIAAGLDHPGDEDIEAAIEKNLTEDEIRAAFDVVMTLSRPQQRPLSGAEVESPPGRPEFPSSGKAPDSISLFSSTPSSGADTSAPT